MKLYKLTDKNDEMKRKEYRVKNTGNSVANYREVWIRCDHCAGTGDAVCSECQYANNKNSKESCTICPDCPECNGHGGYYTKK